LIQVTTAGAGAPPQLALDGGAAIVNTASADEALDPQPLIARTRMK
jgi:hypothetical protein